MILNSLNQTRSIEVITSAGREKGIIFLGKTFVADKCYNSQNEAIAQISLTQASPTTQTSI